MLEILYGFFTGVPLIIISPLFILTPFTLRLIRISIYDKMIYTCKLGYIILSLNVVYP